MHGEEPADTCNLNENGVAPLCDKAIQLKQQIFPIKKSYGENYVNVNALYNGAGTGIMQKLKPLDDMIFELSYKKLQEWRNNKNFKQEIPEFCRLLDLKIKEEYLKLFGI